MKIAYFALLVILPLKAYSYSLSDLAYYSAANKVKKEKEFDESLLSRVEFAFGPISYFGSISFADSFETVTDDFEEPFEKSNALLVRTLNLMTKKSMYFFSKKIHRDPFEVGSNKVTAPKVPCKKENAVAGSSVEDVRAEIALGETENLESILSIYNSSCDKLKDVKVVGLPTYAALSKLDNGYYGILLKHTQLHEFRRKTIPSDIVLVLNPQFELDTKLKLTSTFYSPRLNVAGTFTEVEQAASNASAFSSFGAIYSKYPKSLVRPL